MIIWINWFSEFPCSSLDNRLYCVDNYYFRNLVKYFIADYTPTKYCQLLSKGACPLASKLQVACRIYFCKFFNVETPAASRLPQVSSTCRSSFRLSMDTVSRHLQQPFAELSGCWKFLFDLQKFCVAFTQRKCQ